MQLANCRGKSRNRSLAALTHFPRPPDTLLQFLIPFGTIQDKSECISYEFVTLLTLEIPAVLIIQSQKSKSY